MKEEKKELELTFTERQALIGFNVREQVISKEVIAPYQSDLKQFFEEVETRLGLEPNSLNNTHTVDLNTGKVIEMPKPEMPETPEALPEQ